MPRVQSRRSFLLGLASIIGLSASRPTRVFAADSNSSVAFTSDLAQDYALSLLPIVDGSANLEIEQIETVTPRALARSTISRASSSLCAEICSKETVIPTRT